MRKALFWLWDHWWIPVLGLGAILAFVVTRGRVMPPLDWVKRELEAIRAGADAREAKLKLGAKEAAEKVRKERAEALMKLSEEQTKKAEELKNDPIALSKFLVRASRPMARRGGS